MKRFRKMSLVGLTLTASMLTVGCPQGSPQPPGGGTVSNPTLSVFPRAIGFGELGTVETFTIFNDGAGTLEWTASSNQPWLTVMTPSGSTTTETDRVFLSADRSSLPPGESNATVTVNSNGGDITIPVSITIAGTPLIDVNPEILNLFGMMTSDSFTIENLGDDTLMWEVQAIDPDTGSLGAVPGYLAVNPASGGTAAGEASEVMVTVDPALVPDGRLAITLVVVSPAGTAQVTVNLDEGSATGSGTPALMVDPVSLDFGDSENTLGFDVFNSGDAGSVMTFSVTTDRPNLLSFDPAGGTSVGSNNEFDRDRVTIEVTLDRTELQDDTDAATITITAAGLPPATIDVSAERAPLTIEGAVNRARPPFIQRFVFLIRDQLGIPIDTTDPSVVDELREGFTIFENEELLDLNETNFFVDSADNLKTNLVLLLDYTGSMFNAPPGNGAVINQMVDSSRSFLNDLPPAYRVALMEYHDRDQSNRLIHNFTTNRDSLISALNAFSVPIGQNGSSQEFDAIIDACTRLDNEDIGALPFNDADLRAIVFISDGRDTSSEATLSEVISTATELRCRLYPIGFGENVNAEPLLQMAEETGGHFYPATTALRLEDLLEEEMDAPAGSPGVIVRDLQRQIVLTYTSLLEDQGTFLITLDFEGNSGSFQRDAVFVAGDSRAGQITLQADPVDGGQTELTVRTEYVPRAISQIRFRLFLPPGVTASPVFAPGGLLNPADWILIDEGAGDPALEGVFTALTNDTTSLPFGAFGELFRIQLNNVMAGDEIGFRIDNSIYRNPPFTKFFQYPFTITLNTIASQAGIFPLPPPNEEGGIDPDAPFAFDRDMDTVPDFDDIAPENDEIPF